MPLTLCVLLYPVDGQEDQLAAYEDEVLALIPEYGGTVLSRVRRVGGTTDQPYEVQLIEMPDQAAVDAYQADPRRSSVAGLRDQAIARTDVLPVAAVTGD
ncbi:hypothetical protein GCM10022204_19240 [Microlunatus aurantiacus]|uniref:DUF1330 domain-containing protein n=1 Tax=Microlunatus aurantiacus TaxID=446786 RepID=A0ABP7DCC1_9ACTN